MNPRRVALALLGLLSLPCLIAAPLEVSALRCDTMVNPLGIDSAQPHLSWQLTGDGRDRHQSAYELQVATTAEALSKGPADVWSSGRTATADQLSVPYGGPALRSGQRVFWRVRVWDEAGAASRWSEPAEWTMGLQRPEDWAAKWITDPELLKHVRPQLGYHSEETTNADTPKWLLLDLGTPQRIDEIRLHALRHDVEERLGFPVRLKIEGSVDAAFAQPIMIVDSTTKDLGSLWLSDFTLPAPAGGVTARYVRLTATRLRLLAGVASLAFSQIEVMSAGKNIAVGCKVTASDSWETGPWSSASVVDGLELPGGPSDLARTILLRREFTVKPGLRRALANVCGLGQYELSVNGRRVGQNLLSPGWTDTRKTCLYDTLDLTTLLQPGANAAGLTLAGGMYQVPQVGGRYTKFSSAFRPLVALVSLKLEYTDGSVETLATDDQWRVAAGPTTFAHIFGGEDFDARRVQRGWDSAGFDASGWRAAVVTAGPAGALRGASHAAPLLGTFETLTPTATRELSPSTKVYDLGQNTALVLRLAARGPAGSIIRVRPAELVKADGSVNRGSSGGGNASWNFTLAGTGATESWEPRFFYHGSRYLQVECVAPAGSTELPVVESIAGVVAHSTSEAAGDFVCSDDLFNRIRTLVRWAQMSNMMSVLTDCPHRERLGWLEQYHLNGPSLRYEFDLTRLYAKGFGDMDDAQTAAGLVPSIAPEYTIFNGGFRDSPEWGSALILAAAQHLTWTGDELPLREHYGAMKRYLAYLDTQAKDGLLDFGLGDWYDIGPKPPGLAQLTPISLTATAIYYECTKSFATIAHALGHADDAAAYAQKAEKIRGDFNRAFFNPERKSYSTCSQTALAMPYVLDLVPQADAPAVLDTLVAEVQGRGNAFTSGDIGYRYLLRALGKGRRSDVIFAMNHQSDRPGYGYQLAHGATSLTEAWDARAANSQNHFMLGQIIEWFYGDLAGLAPDPAGPGFAKVLIAPQPVAGITWAKASHASPRGKIAVAWKNEGGEFSLEVDLPANVTATVTLPTADAAHATEGGVDLAKVPGLRVLRREAGAVVCEIGSGHYAFRAPAPQG